MESSFGFAEIKREGASISYSGGAGKIQKEETTWVERSVPKRLEEKLHKLIDVFLKENKV